MRSWLCRTAPEWWPKWTPRAISEELFGKNLPNTAVLGAFAKTVGLVDRGLLFDEIEETFGAQNRKAAEIAFDSVKYLKGGEADV